MLLLAHTNGLESTSLKVGRLPLGPANKGLHGVPRLLLINWTVLTSSISTTTPAVLRCVSPYCVLCSHLCRFCPLQKALVMIQRIREKAGDSVQLSLIVGYEGNIHGGGSLVMHVSGRALVHV